MADEPETHEERCKRELEEQEQQKKQFLKDSKAHDAATEAASEPGKATSEGKSSKPEKPEG